MLGRGCKHANRAFTEQTIPTVPTQASRTMTEQGKLPHGTGMPPMSSPVKRSVAAEKRLATSHKTQHVEGKLGVEAQSSQLSHTNWPRFKLISASSHEDLSRYTFNTKLTLVNYTEVQKSFLAIVDTN